MQVIRTVKELQDKLGEEKKNKKTIGLVPTMGALHKGHISLIKNSVKDNDLTVVSIFVNPTQFNNLTDLEKYPRTEDDDLKLLLHEGVDFVFLPSVEEVYPEPDTREFDLGSIAKVMEGEMRPGHFNGVAQIVSKLFDWVRPERAYFGEKDFQQIAVIKKLLKIINYPIQIIECPIVRENDGLALSSRNTRLSEEQRKVAPNIYKTLKQSIEWKNQGLSVNEVKSKVISELANYPFLTPEYYEIVNSNTLEPVSSWNEIAVTPDTYPIGCVAVYCGEVRLIDNIKY